MRLVLDLNYSVEELIELSRKLVDMNQIETGAIYIQATRGVAERNHSFPTPEVEPAIVAYTKSYDRPL